MSGGSTTVQAYFCLDDIVAVDGSGYNPSGSAKVGGLYIVDPVSGNQTPISTGGYLGQAASVTLEPGTGKILASSRTYGVVRVDPKDGSQEVLLKGGTGWGTGYPTFLDSASNVTKPFVYAAGITIDPMDSSILVTDTGIDLTSAACTPNNVATCGRFPGRIIRIKKGLGAGVYAGTAVVAEAGSLVAPFDLAVDGGSSLYVTDMNAKLGGANDPGMGGIIYLNASNGYAQSTFFSSYNSASPSSAGCPMGITINGSGTIFATVFSYNGFGCSPQAVFSLKPDPSGISPPTFNVVVSAAPGSPGYPSLQYPFGMDTDRSGNVIIADEGSGYGCGGTIFRLNPANAIVTTANGLWNGLIPGNLNPLAISPMVGLGCTPPGQAFLVTPADVVVAKVVVAVNIATPNTPPSNVVVSINPATINEGDTATLSGSFADPDAADTHTVTINWGDGSSSTVLNLAAGSLIMPATTHQYVNNLPSNASYTVNVTVADAKASATGTASIAVNNVAPAITGVSGPSSPLPLGTAASIGVNFTDAGTLDTHNCTFAWGDTTTTTVPATETNGSGSCTGTRTYAAAGVYAVSITVTDKDGGVATSTFTNVVIFSVSISVAPSTSPEATPIALTSTVSVAGGSYAWTVTKNGSAFASGTASNLAFTPDDNGTYVVTLKVTVGSQTGSDSKTITVTNVAPSVAILGVPVTSAEGTAISLTSTASDPSGVDTAAGFIYSWAVTKNGSPYATGSGNSLTFTPNDNGTYVVTFSATDKDGGTGSVSASIAVTNVAPVINTVTGPSAPVALGTALSVVGNYTDAGTADTHTCTLTWDDGLTSAGTVSETSGSGSCTGTHTYAATGVYSITVVVTDKDGGTATSYFKYGVVYSTTEGSVTGNGWFITQPGASPSSAVDEGRTKFGFEAKYKSGATVPSGKTQFQFKIGDNDDDDKHPEKIRFKLQSTSYAWLVISGFESQFKGTGTINGAGSYSFLVTAYDGQRTGGGGIDKFRIKIWDNVTGAVFYDNMPGSPDDMNSANPQPIGGGRVQIRSN